MSQGLSQDPDAQDQGFSQDLVKGQSNPSTPGLPSPGVCAAAGQRSLHENRCVNLKRGLSAPNPWTLR